MTISKYLIAVLFCALLLRYAAPEQAKNLNNSAVRVSKTATSKAATNPLKPERVAARTVDVAPTQTVAATETPVPTPPPLPTSHVALMQAAGINSADYGAADYIVSHESGWNPDATEPTTGAHGLPQALPYSKTGCGWTDSICQLHWANGYAAARYGGWGEARAYWENNRNW